MNFFSSVRYSGLPLLASSFIGLSAPGLHGQSTVLHFSAFDSDEAEFAAGTVPGAGDSPDGLANMGLTLSDDIPTEGVPSGAGDRSILFNGAELITIPGTQQLSHDEIIAAGGFTYETWFKWNGGGTLNAMIDYAGTEKFRINTGSGQLDFNFDSGSGPQILATPVADEWHYVAVVFEHDGEPVSADFKINGSFTWYFDSNEPEGTVDATKDDFGDSLNRTIGVGGHPLGFGADFFNGLLFEPKVSLGALKSEELLFGGGSSAGIVITGIDYDPSPKAPGVTLTWTSSPDRPYLVEYSTDLENWNTVTNTTGAPDESETTILHEFLPGFPDLVDATKVFYRVTDTTG